MAKQIRIEKNNTAQFGIRDKLAYAAGDFGCNMSFALKGTLTVFWTQYMGVDSMLMSGLLLLVQVWGAINDLLIGAAIDNDTRQYRRNKFLAYIMAGSFGLMVAGALCYLPIRSAPTVVKGIVFIAGYIIWDAFYTLVSVPYGSLLSLISNDPGDRTELSTFRSVGSIMGNMLCLAVIPMFIYDTSNELKGDVLVWVALALGLGGFCAFQFMLRSTVIRVEQDSMPKEKRSPFHIFKAIGNFMRNRAAVGATLAPVGNFIGMYGAGTASQILFQSYFKNAQISGVVQMLGYVGLFVWMPMIRRVVDRFGKKRMMTIGSAISCTAYLLMLLLPIAPDANGLALYIALTVLNSLGGGIGGCVSYSLMADAIDYNEWKFGVRDEGTTYAINSFFRKLAQGIGPSLGLMAATALGYQASLGAAQSTEVAMNMRYMVPCAYLLAASMQLIAYGLVYNLDQKTMKQMQSELEARKAAK